AARPRGKRFRTSGPRKVRWKRRRDRYWERASGPLRSRGCDHVGMARHWSSGCRSPKYGATACQAWRDAMTQNSRFFDEIGRMMNGAAGAADGLRREVETLVRSQAERFVADMDLVKREDFDALREQVQLQDAEI